MKRILILVCFFNCVMITANYAQQTQEQNKVNFDKYWAYRYRLINDFMVIGKKPGESIPGKVRNNMNSDGIIQTRVSWGDGGGTTLGWYMAVLATEFHLLKTYGYYNSLPWLVAHPPLLKTP